MAEMDRYNIVTLEEVEQDHKFPSEVKIVMGRIVIGMGEPGKQSDLEW